MHDAMLAWGFQNQVGENYMRLIILGLDALDIDMVEKLDLRALKQVQYGELKVPLSSVSGYPRSPSVWATFLSGEVHEIEFTRNKEGVNLFRGELSRSFIDLNGVKAINVPYHNHEINTLTKLVRLRKKIRWPGTIRRIAPVHNSRTEEIFNEVINSDENHKVIFAFIQTLDTLQHILFLRPKIIQKAYEHMERSFADLKEKLSEDRIIIVSDHGFNFEKGIHSYTGFYSCNHVLKPIPTDISDFYGIVKDFLKGEKTT